MPVLLPADNIAEAALALLLPLLAPVGVFGEDEDGDVDCDEVAAD